VKNPNPAQRRLKELTCSENQKRRRCDIAATPAAFASKTRQLHAFTSTSAFGESGHPIRQQDRPLLTLSGHANDLV
jgi:hypothetical protein